ncbi:hypothetical protein B296_00012502 [Ensete ventricosum]|uniref:Uncharacterized protein n=1 Tax=Ensete ventricosum TaxID=4639 RepID=A0A427B755_ENSVE|nr:hypothetical protein B296_00012502 [Ensete ventricosum]
MLGQSEVRASGRGSDHAVRTRRKLVEGIRSLSGVRWELVEGIKGLSGVRRKLTEGIRSLMGVRRELARIAPIDVLEDHQGLTKSLSGVVVVTREDVTMVCGCSHSVDVSYYGDCNHRVAVRT